MVDDVTVTSRSREQLINVDGVLRDFVSRSGVQEGVLTVFVPHTTAGVTINENADPTVVQDLLAKARELVPHKGGYRHAEGNSDAHIKASLFGSYQSVIVSGGKPLLGTWQSVFFCEFDGPRSRRMILRIG
ncbi:MAG: secondary thiamine-phosphate synthase enzyme YjbQ [Spirochaetota bacterium]